MHQEACDEEVDAAEDRVASEVFDMCLVVELKVDYFEVKSRQVFQ